MINEKIVPISPYGFRFPTETEMAIDETLKICGISGEEASMIAIEVMKKLGKSDEISACCRGLAESAQSEYEPVKAEDFAKTMSENTIYSFMTWHGEALELMERQGFVICKKTRQE